MKQFLSERGSIPIDVDLKGNGAYGFSNGSVLENLALLAASSGTYLAQQKLPNDRQAKPKELNGSQPLHR